MNLPQANQLQTFHHITKLIHLMINYKKRELNLLTQTFTKQLTMLLFLETNLKTLFKSLKMYLKILLDNKFKWKNGKKLFILLIVVKFLDIYQIKV